VFQSPRRPSLSTKVIESRKYKYKYIVQHRFRQWADNDRYCILKFEFHSYIMDCLSSNSDFNPPNLSAGQTDSILKPLPHVFVPDSLKRLTILSTVSILKGPYWTSDGERVDGTLYTGIGHCLIPDCTSGSQLWLARDGIDNALYAIKESCASHVRLEAASFEFRPHQGSETGSKRMD
jgi:hypothetical protein